MPAIIGAVIGCALAITAVCFLLRFLRRRKQKRSEQRRRLAREEERRRQLAREEVRRRRLAHEEEERRRLAQEEERRRLVREEEERRELARVQVPGRTQEEPENADENNQGSGLCVICQ